VPFFFSKTKYIIFIITANQIKMGGDFVLSGGDMSILYIKIIIKKSEEFYL